MKVKIGLFFRCVAIPLIVGIVSALLTRGGMEGFSDVVQPPLSPPSWLFPIVWTILYTLMGIASYLVLVSEKEEQEIQKAIRIYIWQLVVNFLWPTFFFNLEWYLFSFLWILLLWVLIIIMIKRFYSISKIAGYLLVPYFIWVTFATYLTFAIWLLN